MQVQCAKVKENIHKKVQSLKPTYAIPRFIEYLCKDLPMSKNPVMEGSKMIKEINSDLEKRWQEFRKNDSGHQDEKIRELLHRNYLVYSRTDHYREYLCESIRSSKNPLERFQKIEEELEKGERKPPFEWKMSLEKKMDPALLERLERVRSDKFFQEYVHIKTQWLERVKDRKPEGLDKDFEAHKGYVETLPKLHEWIMDQRYFNFTNEKTEPYFRFLERDFNELKRRKEQQRQMQSQSHIAPAVPQYSNQQVVNQHQNQHSYQHPQQRTQTNIQPNQQQMLHQQQQQQYANHSHSQQSPQYTQQEQNHQHYLNNKSHYTDPHAGPQINNNSLNQPSSYRSSYPTTGTNNHTEATNSHVNNQYSMPYDERDHHNSHTAQTSAQQYPTNSHDSHNSYSNQYPRPQQSSYSQQANTQQQSGYNQQVKHNEQPFEWPSFSGPDSTFNQHNNSNFYSGSTNQNYSTSHNQSQGQSDSRNQYDFQAGQTNSAPYQQDFSEFFSHHDYADSYVADGKRHREDYGDFGNITNYNQESHGNFIESKAENYQVQDFLQTSKKVKTNPSPQQELNIAQAKSNTIPSTFTPSTMEEGSPQAKLHGIDLGQVRKDTRFHIVDEVAYPGHFEITINRNDSGTMSAYEKISLKILQDGSKKIEIIDMANYDEFFKVFGNDLVSSLNTGQLEHVLDIWIKFLDECAMRADSKLKEWEDIF